MRRDIIGFALAGALAALGGACTTGGDSLIILQNQIPGDGCTLSAGQSDTFISRGLIDTQADTGYVFNPVVQSNAMTTNATTPRIVTVQGADVSLTLQSGFTLSGVDPSLLKFTRKFSGTIQPGGTTSFSFIILDTGLLDAIGQTLQPGDDPVEVDAEVKIFGNLNGSSVQSQPFDYPILVCNGCMTRDQGACTSLASDFTASTGGVCNTLQDFYLDCCTASDGSTVCPAVPETPAVR